MWWRIKLKIDNSQYITLYTNKEEKIKAIFDVIKKCEEYINYEVKTIEIISCEKTQAGDDVY